MSSKDKRMIAYLVYMTERLILMKKILKDTGSIYYHCDPTASHYLKVIMDGIFGSENFKNDIVWKSSPNKNDKEKKKFFNRINNILYYCKTEKSVFNPIFENLSNEYIKKTYTKKDNIGKFMTAPLYSKTTMGGYATQKEFEFMGLKHRWMYSKKNITKF